MITYLKSETERLEKGCKKWVKYGPCDSETRCGEKYFGELVLCPSCQAKLSTLIKTYWIFARKDIDELMETCYILWDAELLMNLNNIVEKKKEIISYYEAKAKEHKIKLEDRK